jgi:hypothetical protein
MTAGAVLMGLAALFALAATVGVFHPRRPAWRGLGSIGLALAASAACLYAGLSVTLGPGL